MTKIGTVIDGKYEILKEIGRGGMSVVYLAMDSHLNKQWAVKEVKKQGNDKNNEIVVQSLLTEANMLKKLDHAALPRIVDIIDNGKTIYVVMDYIEGESLDKVLERRGAQSQDAVIAWAKQLCEVLNYLHTRKPAIVYRDMKPANIMLKPDGTVKLFDFGIAREYKEKNNADTQYLGTRGYAAPEQLSNTGQTDARTDIYCFGATIYHLITGKSPCEPPYQLYPIRYWNPKLSPGLEAIILKCTQNNPQNRYSSCMELLYDLENLEKAEPQYRLKLKKKVATFVAPLAVSVAFLVAGLGFMTANTIFKKDDFDSTLNKAVATLDYTEKFKEYENAADIIDDDVSLYQFALEDFLEKYYVNENSSFNDDDIASLITLLGREGFTSKIKTTNPDQYSEICYSIGNLYWYYYESTSVSISNRKFKLAKDWYDKVIEADTSGKYPSASIYSKIAESFINIDRTETGVVSAENTVDYKKFWNNLNEAVDSAFNSNGNESAVYTKDIDRFQSCYQLLYAIRRYSVNIAKSGVSKEEMLSRYNRVIELVEGIEVADSESRIGKLYSEILNQKQKIEAEKKIEVAYKGRG